MPRRTALGPTAASMVALLGTACAGGSLDDYDSGPSGLPAATAQDTDTDAGSASAGPGATSAAPSMTTAGSGTGDAPTACSQDLDCDDQNACTVDTCGDGTCVQQDLDCDDGLDCTEDACDPELGCSNTPDDAACDDADACNGAETCDVALGCRPGAQAVICDDADACTVDTCDPDTGACGTTPLQACVDADGCCVPGCAIDEDDDCSCDNIAPQATPSSSGGGQDAFGFGPANWIDGVDQAGCEAAGCNQCYGWILNSSSAGGAYMQLQWSQTVTIGAMVLDGNSTSAGCLSTADRRPYSGQIQAWDGISWVDVTAWTAAESDVVVDFVPPVVTDSLRLFDVVTAPGGSNTLAFEWSVYAVPGCRP